MAKNLKIKNYERRYCANIPRWVKNVQINQLCSEHLFEMKLYEKIQYFNVTIKKPRFSYNGMEIVIH